MRMQWWPWKQPVEQLRRRLMEHEGCAREYEAEAARCARMRLWEGYADHIGWQAWHERQAQKLRRKLAVLEAEAWLARKSPDQARQAGVLRAEGEGERSEHPPSRDDQPLRFPDTCVPGNRTG